MLPLCQGTESGKTAAENFDEQDEPGSYTRGEFGLQFGEVGPAVLDDHHHLAVENGLTGKIEGTGNHGEPFGPVQAVAGEDLALALFRWIWTR